MTADVNEKGVLDVDTVKGCTAGMRARPDGGCYNSCYAAKIAKFRGIDFGFSVKRVAYSPLHRKEIERAVINSPLGFFRIGTMGDPCHAWEHTIETVEWLSHFAVPVIITKHWKRATDSQLFRLIKCDAIINVSLSALDTNSELRHRKRELFRYVELGGVSIARVISCDFIRSHPEGERMGMIQDELFRLPFMLDNPLRVSASHWLVRDGIIRLTKIKDLNAVRTISLANPNTYLGHCNSCSELCGVGMTEQNPSHIYQIDIFDEKETGTRTIISECGA